MCRLLIGTPARRINSTALENSAVAILTYGAFDVSLRVVKVQQGGITDSIHVKVVSGGYQLAIDNSASVTI